VFLLHTRSTLAIIAVIVYNINCMATLQTLINFTVLLY